jgi:hypothetical protein
MFLQEKAKIFVTDDGVVPNSTIKQNSNWHNAFILIYIQQDATLHSLFYLETALHVLGGTSTHLQERKQLHLQHLVFVKP